MADINAAVNKKKKETSETKFGEKWILYYTVLKKKFSSKLDSFADNVYKLANG